MVGEMDCTDTVLSLGTDKPGKLPQQFVIQSLKLRSIGAGQPMDFTAKLTNPKPVGPDREPWLLRPLERGSAGSDRFGRRLLLP